MVMTYKIIRDQQQAWALQRGVNFDEDGYTFSLDDNLLLPFLPEVKRDFQEITERKVIRVTLYY